MTKEERKNKKFRMYDGKKIKRPNWIGFSVVSIFLVIVLVISVVVQSFGDYFGVVDNIIFTKAPTGATADSITEEAKAVTLQEVEELRLLPAI